MEEKEYTIAIFDDSKTDMETLKRMFKEGKCVLLANFPTISFKAFDEFMDEQLEQSLKI